MRPPATRIRAAFVMATALCLGGCGLLTLPADLPAALEHVMASPTSFAAVANDPLQNVTAGTALDALDDLSGCWGAYLRMSDPSGRGVALETYEVLSFAPATKTLTRYVVDTLAGFASVFVQRGTYAVVDSGHLTFSVQSIQANMGPGPLVDVTSKYETLPQYAVDVTRSGKQLKTCFRMPADDPRTPAGFADVQDLIHKSFACSE